MGPKWVWAVLMQVEMEVSSEMSPVRLKMRGFEGGGVVIVDGDVAGRRSWAVTLQPAAALISL